MSNTPDGFLFPQLADPTFPFVQRVLRPINPRLWLTLHEPWADFQRARDHDPDLRDYREGEVAGWLHPKIIRSATRLFADQKGVICSTEQGLFFVNFNDKVLIVFKKLAKIAVNGEVVLVRSNALTDGNIDFWDQRHRELFPYIPRIIVGYLFAKELTEIRVAVAHPRSKGLDTYWHYYMPDQSRAALRIARPRPDSQPDAQPDSGFTVIPKDRAKKRKGGLPQADNPEGGSPHA